MNEELEQLSDPDLMKRSAAGRQEAFETVVRRHQKPLLNFFRRMGASYSEAEDMVQETFLRLFDYRFRYRPLAKFTTFLYRLASHVRVDGLRKLQRQPKTSALTEQSGGTEESASAWGEARHPGGARQAFREAAAGSGDGVFSGTAVQRNRRGARHTAGNREVEDVSGAAGAERSPGN